MEPIVKEALQFSGKLCPVMMNCVHDCENITNDITLSSEEKIRKIKECFEIMRDDFKRCCLEMGYGGAKWFGEYQSE